MKLRTRAKTYWLERGCDQISERLYDEWYFWFITLPIESGLMRARKTMGNEGGNGSAD